MRVICKICGNEFNAKTNGKYCQSCIDRICSQYIEYLSQPKRGYLKNCMVCGKPIKRGPHTSSMRGRATTCSDDCHRAQVYITQKNKAKNKNGRPFTASDSRRRSPQARHFVRRIYGTFIHGSRKDITE